MITETWYSIQQNSNLEKNTKKDNSFCNVDLIEKQDTCNASINLSEKMNRLQ